MRLLRPRLTRRDRLNMQIALALATEQAIAKVKDSRRELEVTVFAREAAGYITASHRLAARHRGRGELADQCDRWTSALAAAVTEAAARGITP